MEAEKIKILAIDDNRDNLITLKALIAEALPEAVTITALNGEKGIELASLEDPDVILLDIVMPDMDGFDVCRKLKIDAKLRDIPVVFVTALKGDKGSRIHALECGAEAFLAKPIDEIELIAQIRAMIKIKMANVEKRDEKTRLAQLVAEQTSELIKSHASTLQLLNELKSEIEARKKSEKELLESEEKFSKAFLTSPYAIVITRPSDGCFIDVNNAFTSITGFTREEALAGSSVSLNIWVDGDDRADMLSALMDNRKIKDMEFQFRRKDGEIITASYSAEIIHLKGENLVLSCINDITERKLAEKKYRELHTQLMHQDKLATIGQLAAGVAHEINNPIGFIGSNMVTLGTYIEKYNSYIESLENDLRSVNSSGALPESVAELRRLIKLDYMTRDINQLVTENNEGLERIRRIVHDLSTFSRSDVSVTSLADLNSCLECTVNIVMNEIKYNADLVLEYGDLPLVLCNAQQINQVFMNLLVNASHAIREKSGQTGKIVIRTWCENNNAFVSVSDTGCGIPSENIGKVFDAFFTTRELEKGTGLGLSISDGIIQQHGGEISVTSDVGIGSTFTVRLPVDGIAATAA